MQPYVLRNFFDLRMNCPRLTVPVFLDRQFYVASLCPSIQWWLSLYIQPSSLPFLPPSRALSNLHANFLCAEAGGGGNGKRANEQGDIWCGTIQVTHREENTGADGPISPPNCHTQRKFMHRNSRPGAYAKISGSCALTRVKKKGSLSAARANMQKSTASHSLFVATPCHRLAYGSCSNFCKQVFFLSLLSLPLLCRCPSNQKVPFSLLLSPSLSLSLSLPLSFTQQK